MLDKLVKVPATSPAATRVYLTRVLDQPLMGALKILSLVAIVEGGGRFAALAPNPDKAGLSLGIIQWAQRPGRLFELLDAWNKTDAAKMNRIFGGAARVEAILAHAKKGEAGLKADGTSNDPAVDLLSEDSRKRFREALLSPKFQAAQVGTALTAFADARRFLRTFATKIVSERGFAFMLDLANQHGLGGAKKIYTQAVKDTMTEGQAIQAMTEESVRRIAKQFPPKLGEKESVFTRGGRERREFYRDTPLLSDAPLGGGPPLPPPPP